MNKTEYKIDYNTGAGNIYIVDDLETAMLVADEGAAYTQQDIVIKIVDDECPECAWDVVCRRYWYGTTDGIENESDPIQFGDFGFYADWQEI